MSIANSIRAQIPPIHPEGYPFIGGFALASLILFWIWTPLGWIGTLLTILCALFFRDPVRGTPHRGGAGRRAHRDGDAGIATGRTWSRRQTAAAHLDLHERLQLPCEPQSGRR